MNKPVVIVGGGWAGIAAAVELARQQIPVILMEAAPTLGGRARRVEHDNMPLDNGQHLFIGAYRSMLSILQTIGIDADDVFIRNPLSLRIKTRVGAEIILDTPRLPAPLHLLSGLLAAKGIEPVDKWRALTQLKAMLTWQSDEDISVSSLLRKFKQPRSLNEYLWKPLCLASLNTPAETASAQVFARTLQESFNRDRSDSDLLIAKKDIGRILPEPAQHYIQHNQGTIHFNTRVRRISFEHNSVTGIETKQTILNADYVIVATPPKQTVRLLNDAPALTKTTARLSTIEYEPICTVYLQYPAHIKLNTPFIGLHGGIGQWLFDRRLTGLPGMMAMVISADGPHMQLSNDELIAQLETEIMGYFPHWPKANNAWAIREKRATFRCSVGINQLRPANATTVKGLWLAGDYTNTGLPATLEGAVRSGIQCAHQLINHYRKSN